MNKGRILILVSTVILLANASVYQWNFTEDFVWSVVAKPKNLESLAYFSEEYHIFVTATAMIGFVSLTLTEDCVGLLKLHCVMMMLLMFPMVRSLKFFTLHSSKLDLDKIVCRSLGKSLQRISQPKTKQELNDNSWPEFWKRNRCGSFNDYAVHRCYIPFFYTLDSTYVEKTGKSLFNKMNRIHTPGDKYYLLKEEEEYMFLNRSFHNRILNVDEIRLMSMGGKIYPIKYDRRLKMIFPTAGKYHILKEDRDFSFADSGCECYNRTAMDSLDNCDCKTQKNVTSCYSIIAGQVRSLFLRHNYLCVCSTCVMLLFLIVCMCAYNYQEYL